MKCDYCDNLEYGSNLTYDGTWEMCSVARNKNIHISDFNKKIFGKNYKHFNKIDFKKMELVTRTMFQIGYIVANRKTRLIVDNPYSKW